MEHFRSCILLGFGQTCNIKKTKSIQIGENGRMRKRRLWVGIILILGVILGSGVYIYRDHSESYYYVLTPRKVKTGFFSTFNMVLGALDFCEKMHCRGLEVDFGEGGLYFEPQRGQNWWNYYFEPIRLGSMKKARICHFSSKEKRNLSLKAEFELPLERARELIDKYVHIKPEILEKVGQFEKTYFQGYSILGVHYRGTDKVQEAPRVPYEEMEAQIERAAQEQVKEWKIFVATDDQLFLDFVKERWPGKVVAFDAIRSVDGKPIHLTNRDNYQKGEEAIIDCLLLSRCNLLIKTASNLSDCSLQFNPSLPVVRVCLD